MQEKEMTIKDDLVKYINTKLNGNKFIEPLDAIDIVLYAEDSFKIVFPDRPIFTILKNSIPSNIKNTKHKHRYHYVLKILRQYLLPVLPRYSIRNYQCEYYTCLCEPSPCSCELSLELEAKAEAEVKAKEAEEIKFQELMNRFKKVDKEHKKHKHLGNLNKTPKVTNLDNILSL